MREATVRNILYCGDNLTILRNAIPTASVDLIYLDPPFNSHAAYHVTAKAPARRLRAFDDTWRWDASAERAREEIVSSGHPVAGILEALVSAIGRNGLTAYLFMMTPRLRELHRALKPTGSLYLHCDPTASHYLKIVLDAIFGPANFRNEIIWRRTGAHAPRRRFGPIHDNILYYSRTDHYYFHVQRLPYLRGHVARRYTADAAGRLRFTSGGNVLTGPGATDGESGMAWRGFDPSAKNRHWAVPGFLAAQMPPSMSGLGVLAKLEALYQAGLIEITPGAVWPTAVRYLTPDDGQPIQDIWAYQPYTEGVIYGSDAGIDADVAWLGPTDHERLGYQTQKPLGLLERIIHSSCPDDGLVLDPFCGCGTTICAAHTLRRRWIGIDSAQIAIEAVISRLKAMFALEPGRDYQMVGDADADANVENAPPL